jgi:hypothetical protein
MGSFKLLTRSNYYKWFLLFYPAWLLLFWIIYHNDPMVTYLAYFIYVTLLYIVLTYLSIKIYTVIKADYFNLWLIISVLVFTFIALSPVIINEGWPLNHDHLTWKIRTETYVAHICKLDIIPIWSSRDGAGMGAPDPLYYHKTFYYISSFFYIITGKMKASILLSLGSLLIIGILGIYKTATYLGNNKVVSLIISLSFAFLNYTMSNWFLRGAMAEFTAMTIVPFLILEELKLLKTKNFNYSTGVVLFLIYYSHSIIGYYSLFTLLIALIFVSFNITKSQASNIFKKLSISALVIMGLILVYIIPMYILSDYYNPSQIKANEMVLRYKFVEFIRYLYDYKYEWFSEPFWQFSVQFDLPVLILIIVSLIIFIRNKSRIQVLSVKKQAILFLLVLDLFFILLQLRPFNFFYEYVPGADFIQFPWRLLTFIQILNLLILSWFFSFFNILKSKKVSYIISGILLVSVIAIYPPFKGTKYWWYKTGDLEQITNVTCNFGEYLPSIYGDEFLFLKQHMFLFKDRGIEIKEKDNYLEIRNDKELRYEAKKVILDARFENVSEVILPITYSSLTRLYIIDPYTRIKQQIPIFRTDSDPRIKAILPFGVYTLQLDLPTLKNLFIRSKRPYNRDEFELIDCDAERITVNGNFLASKCGFHLFNNVEARSNEKYRSGNYSIKLTKDKPYGFTYMMNSKKDYKCEWQASVWRFGGDKGNLTVYGGKHLFISQNIPDSIDTAGWALLKIRFKIPPQIYENDEIKIFVHNLYNELPVYFDDFKLEKIKQTQDN